MKSELTLSRHLRFPAGGLRSRPCRLRAKTATALHRVSDQADDQQMPAAALLPGADIMRSFDTVYFGIFKSIGAESKSVAASELRLCRSSLVISIVSLRFSSRPATTYLWKTLYPTRRMCRDFATSGSLASGSDIVTSPSARINAA